MNAIVAVDNNWAIGRDNELLIKIPEDMKHFKELTMNKIVVMGRKTLESLPNGKPLKDRINIVLTRDVNYTTEEGVFVCHSKNEVLETLAGLILIMDNLSTDDIFIIGGEEIYKLFHPYIDRYYVTAIDEMFKNANKNIINLYNDPDFNIISCDDRIWNDIGILIEFKFVIYERRLYNVR